MTENTISAHISSRILIEGIWQENKRTYGLNTRAYIFIYVWTI